jgi:hypothetical protein
MAKWQVSGDYFETCNCDYLCPCIYTNLAGKPTHTYCDVAMVYHIDKGHFDGTQLDGLNFAVVAHTPDAMGLGNWEVGLIIDERADAKQREALAGIGSGQAGGPISALAPLVTKMLGVEYKPIHFQKSGLGLSASVAGMLDEAVEGTPSPTSAGQPLFLENTLHPANPKIALAHATRSHLHIFGLNWDQTDGKNNGHFAPFDWKA